MHINLSQLRKLKKTIVSKIWNAAFSN
jgi:hypothetical protein